MRIVNVTTKRIANNSADQLNLFDAPLRPTPTPLHPWKSVMALPVMILAAANAGFSNGKNPLLQGLCKGHNNLLLEAYETGLSWLYGDEDTEYTSITHSCRYAAENISLETDYA
jgi:hypothetical protein